jgi:hypothetical protein
MVAWPEQPPKPPRIVAYPNGADHRQSNRSRHRIAGPPVQFTDADRGPIVHDLVSNAEAVSATALSLQLRETLTMTPHAGSWSIVVG